MERFVGPTLLATSLWHASAVYYFIWKGRGCVKLFFKHHTPESVALGNEILRFLGGINLGYSLLALFTLCYYLIQNKIRKSNLLILGIANFSQFIFDILLHKNKLVNSSFVFKITFPDGLFGVLNLLLAYYLYKEKKNKKSVQILRINE